MHFIYCVSVLINMVQATLILLLVAVIAAVYGQDTVPDEDCLRCLCHARTGCYRLRNCASYSIGMDYWRMAGKPTVADDDRDDSSSYKNCVENDGCVMRTIRGYVAQSSIKDCNCDGEVNCKDFAAIHYKGENCRSDFDPTRLTRLDKCLKERVKFPPAPGWNMQCILPPSQ